MRSIYLILFFVFAIFLSLSSASTLPAASSNCSAYECTVFLSQSAQTFPINNIIYNISLTSINNKSATLKINNEKRVISFPANSNRNYFEIESSTIVDNIKINSMNLFIGGLSGGSVTLRYSSATKFCIDTDKDTKYADGKNYYKKGKVISGGYYGKDDNLDGQSDYNYDNDTIVEIYCDTEGPKTQRYVCPNGILEPGVCIDINKPKINPPATNLSSNQNLSMQNNTFTQKITINLSIEDIKSKIIGIDNISYISLVQEGNKSLYLISGTKRTKLFFFIPISEDIEQKIDAQTGIIVSTKRPWWSFLARDI